MPSLTLSLSSPSYSLPHMLLDFQLFQRLILCSWRHYLVEQSLHHILRRLIPSPHIRKVFLPQFFRDGKPQHGFPATLHLGYDFVVDRRLFFVFFALAGSIAVHFHVGVPEPPVAVAVVEAAAEFARITAGCSDLVWSQWI